MLAQGQEYLKKSPPGAAGNLQTNLRTLKQRWDNVTARANDKKIKLEIALKEATEFHDALQVILYTLSLPTSPNFINQSVSHAYLFLDEITYFCSMPYLFSIAYKRMVKLL